MVRIMFVVDVIVVLVVGLVLILVVFGGVLKCSIVVLCIWCS